MAQLRLFAVQRARLPVGHASSRVGLTSRRKLAPSDVQALLAGCQPASSGAVAIGRAAQAPQVGKHREDTSHVLLRTFI